MANAGIRSSRWSRSGMTALVTGGTRGIGQAIAEELAELGASVYTLSRNEAELDKLLQDWVSRGFNGKLNILVNNVGTYMKKPTSESTAEDYILLISTNLESSYPLCQLAYHLLKASEKGNIVFISSIVGLVNVNHSSTYAATKAVINQLTKNLACEWAKDNIRVNSVAPWYTRTPLIEDQLSVKEIVEMVNSRTPMMRMENEKKSLL